MPFRLRFQAGGLPRLRFAVSPLGEVRQAVRTVRAPSRHDRHLPWLRRIRDAAAGLDLRPLWLLMPDHGPVPAFLCPLPGGPVASIEEELDQVRTAEPSQVRDELARSLASTPGAADGPQGRAMLDDPERTITVLADLLELTWKALIAPDWPRLRTLLEADIAFRSRRLAEGGPARLFADLHPKLSWDNGTLTAQTGDTAAVRSLRGEELVLVPSVFVWPDVAGDVEPPPSPGGKPARQPAVVYPAHGAACLWDEPGGTASEALATLLGRGRATVLTALAEPATTTALAQRLGFAPSSVSAHLSALRAAGLLVSTRHGHQVVYEQTPLGIALANT